MCVMIVESSVKSLDSGVIRYPSAPGCGCHVSFFLFFCDLVRFEVDEGSELGVFS